MRTRTSKKVVNAEAKVGLPLAKYFQSASDRGLKQEEMAVELGVTKPTVVSWLRKQGFEFVTAYRKVA
jgi:predicted XRE-type DNA-binding protein